LVSRFFCGSFKEIDKKTGQPYDINPHEPDSKTVKFPGKAVYVQPGNANRAVIKNYSANDGKKINHFLNGLHANRKESIHPTNVQPVMAFITNKLNKFLFPRISPMMVGIK